MSHFYGTLRGSRGEATRCGTAKSGITTYTAGWGGAIRVEVYQDKYGTDRFKVSLVPWQSSGGRELSLCEGRLDANAYGADGYELPKAG